MTTTKIAAAEVEGQTAATDRARYEDMCSKLSEISPDWAAHADRIRAFADKGTMPFDEFLTWSIKLLEADIRIDAALADTDDTALLALCAKHAEAFAFANGTPAGTKKERQAYEKVRAIERQIAATGANSPAGVRAKASLIEAKVRDYGGGEKHDFDGVEPSILSSLLSDIVVMAIPDGPDTSAWDAALAGYAAANAECDARHDAYGAMWEAVRSASPCPAILTKNGEEFWLFEDQIIKDQTLTFDQKVVMVPRLRKWDRQREAMKRRLDHAAVLEARSTAGRAYWDALEGVFTTPAPDVKGLLWKLRRVLSSTPFDTDPEDLDNPDFIAEQLAGDIDERHAAQLYQDAVRLVDPTHPILHIQPYDVAARFEEFNVLPGFRIDRRSGLTYDQQPGRPLTDMDGPMAAWRALPKWKKDALKAYARTVPDEEQVEKLVTRCKWDGPEHWEKLLATEIDEPRVTEADVAEALKRARANPPRMMRDLIRVAEEAWARFDQIHERATAEGVDAQDIDGWNAAYEEHEAAVQAVRALTPSDPWEINQKIAFLATPAGNVEGDARENLRSLGDDLRILGGDTPRAEVGLGGGAA